MHAVRCAMRLLRLYYCLLTLIIVLYIYIVCRFSYNIESKTCVTKILAGYIYCDTRYKHCDFSSRSGVFDMKNYHSMDKYPSVFALKQTVFIEHSNVILINSRGVEIISGSSYVDTTGCVCGSFFAV